MLRNVRDPKEVRRRVGKTSGWVGRISKLAGRLVLGGLDLYSKQLQSPTV